MNNLFLDATAKCQVGNPVRDKYLAEQPAVRIDAMHPVGRARPDISVFIDTNSVGITGLDLVKDLAAG